MTNLAQREYYRIFTGTNQTEGYENVCLGYEANTVELKFNKDKTTYFHYPFFTNNLPLSSSTLGSSGAAPGPIPAMADRIYKKLGNYDKTTPWGPSTTSDRQDGTWLCSWFYANTTSDTPIWVDRYYQPGRIAYQEALEGTANFTDYITNTPMYYDVPTTLVFEPGGYFEYFHRGEKTTKNIVDSFSGNNKNRLKLNIEDWSFDGPQDTSIYNNTVIIDNIKNDWFIESKDPGYVDRASLSFDHTDFVNCFVQYASGYNLENEFTASLWINNSDWTNATSTQLLGNLQRSGYGLFYNNLHYNPYFVVPETTYGHLYYFNINGEVYLDKNIQNQLAVPVSPTLVAHNLNSETIVFDQVNSRLTKYNHLGDVLALSINSNGTPFQTIGEGKILLLDGSNNCTVITTSATYIFNQDLILQTVNTTNRYTNSEQAAYNMSGQLIRESNCIDIRFDNDNNKWTIKSDSNLYFNNQKVQSLENIICTNLAIDPENNLWVMSKPNVVYKIDTTNQQIIQTFEVGVLNAREGKKNISFIKRYNRQNNNFTWYSYVYVSTEQMIYEVTLEGKTLKNIFIPQKSNIADPGIELQDKNLLTFNSLGDFTGYELRRIFHKVLYNNNPQIQLKVGTKPPYSYLPYSIHTLSIPVQYFLNKTWHLITATVKNNEFNLYVDNFLRDGLILPNNIDLGYLFENDLYIGCPNGKNSNLNLEIASTSIIWNGYIDSIKIYDYPIKSEFIRFLPEEKTIGTDIIWDITTTPLQYVETIERFFKHQLPGFKSNFFKIKIAGAHITDEATKQIVENNIRTAINRLKPAYTELLQVEWVN